MTQLKIDLALQPPAPELSKKVIFYKGMAVAVFLIGLVYLLVDASWQRLPIFLLLLFAAYKIYATAADSDYLKILSAPYLLLDDQKFVLQQSRFSFQSSPGTSLSFSWPDVRQLLIDQQSFEVVLFNGQHQLIDLGFLSASSLQLVKEQLYEIKDQFKI